MLNFLQTVWLKVVCPDLLVCVRGTFLAIEVKASNGKPSALQLYNREAIRNAGGFAIVLYPKQWEEFKKFIEGLLAHPYLTNFDDQKKFDEEGDENEKI